MRTMHMGAMPFFHVHKHMISKGSEDMLPREILHFRLYSQALKKYLYMYIQHTLNALCIIATTIHVIVISLLCV